MADHGQDDEPQPEGPVVCEAPRPLFHTVTAMRPDWDRQATWDAMLAARAAGWDFGRTASALIALARNTDDGDPQALVDAAGRPTKANRRPAPLDPELRAALLAGDKAAVDRLTAQHHDSHGTAA